MIYRTLEQFILKRASLDNNTLTYISSHFKQVKTKRNEILLDYNQVSQQYYFINRGCIRLFTIGKNGEENSRFFAFEGNFATALPSFIDGQPAEEYLQTIEKSELLSISRKDFFKLVEEIPAFAKIYTEILELGFIVAQKRIYGFQSFDALDKVQWIIKNQPQLLLRVSNKLVASYLGIAASTLSRIKAKL